MFDAVSTAVMVTPVGNADDSTNCCPTRTKSIFRYPTTSVTFVRVVEAVVASKVTRIYELLPLPRGLAPDNLP